MNRSQKRVVVLTGAGMSAESGLKTFRDSGGLWEGHRVEDVATPEAWQRNPELVLEFYNQRRRDLLKAEPNDGHRALVQLERDYDVTIVTQNVDDLHERAGSSRIIHLHGELRKCRSSIDPSLIYPIEGTDLKLGDSCQKGSQLRPHIVWFGEMVPEMDRAIEVTKRADVVIVVGTSMVVYPAAGLIDQAPAHAPKYIVDPQRPPILDPRNIEFVELPAGKGVPALVQRLCARYSA